MTPLFLFLQLGLKILALPSFPPFHTERELSLVLPSKGEIKELLPPRNLPPPVFPLVSRRKIVDRANNPWGDPPPRKQLNDSSPATLHSTTDLFDAAASPFGKTPPFSVKGEEPSYEDVEICATPFSSPFPTPPERDRSLLPPSC